MMAQDEVNGEVLEAIDELRTLKRGIWSALRLVVYVTLVNLLISGGALFLIREQGRQVDSTDRNVRQLTEFANQIQAPASPEERARNAAISQAVLRSIPQILDILCMQYPVSCQQAKE